MRAVSRVRGRALRPSTLRTTSSLRSFSSSSSLPRPVLRSIHNTVSQTRYSTTSDSRASHGVHTIHRDPDFAELNEEDVKFFRETLQSPSAIIDNLTTTETSDDMEPFNTDWMRKYRGASRLVLKPRNADEVSKILRYCNERKLAVVPQGGNTGLVGGSIPVFDEVVISMVRMNQIRSFDATSGVFTVDAGVILDTASEYLSERDHIFPLDLGAKGSCHIGGNIATNAGGLRVLRYGTLPGNVLGLETVLPDGTIVNSLSGLRKNNTGYSLKQLFIGSEGTIGIITGVSILCPPRPQSVNLAYLGVESYAKVCEVFRRAKGGLSEILSAFEMMDGESQDLVREKMGIKPVEGRYPFYCLLETSGSNREHDIDKLEGFLESAMTDGVVADGVLAQDETQMKNIWRCREDIAEVINNMGGTYKYDVSIPLPRWYQLVIDCRSRLKEFGLFDESGSSPVQTVVGYGHIGDCNLHLNISVKEYSDKIENALEPWIYEWIKANNGSISAEHGIGFAKKKFVGYSQDETALRLMKQIRHLYDPNGIMNPYKYI